MFEVLGERNYKMAAHDALSRMGLGTAAGTGEAAPPLLSSTDFAGKLRQGLKGLNLLALYETLAFKDGLASDRKAAADYRDALAAVCGESVPDRHSFESLIEVVRALPATAHRVDSWPILTLVPFIARPDAHMLLKPQMTRLAAERLAFDLLYASDLNWATYERLLDMSRILLERLRPHGATDFIDVQSFMWVTAGDKSAA